MQGRTTFVIAQRLVTLKTDDPANEPQLAQEIEKVRALYGTGGYMKASAKLKPQLDDATGVANYKVELDEGAQYRMGSLDVEGLDNNASARVQELWTLREGDVFSTDSLRHIPGATAIGLGTNYDWTVKSEMSFDDTNHTVDVNLHFEPRSKSK